MMGVFPAVGLTSVAIISFQVTIMRFLALAQWHHFAWMVISMAMLGFGAAGTVLFLLRRPLLERFDTAFPLLLLATAATIAGSAQLSGFIGTFDAFLLFFEWNQVRLLLVTYLLYALPFFFAGLAITLAFYRTVNRIGKLYFINLLGSGAGAVLIVILLFVVPLERLPGVLALLPLGAAFLVFPRHLPRVFVGAAIPVVLIGLVSIRAVSVPEPSQYKDINAAMQLPDATVVHSSTSPYGRLDLVHAPALRYAPGLSLQYREEPPVRPVLFNDGSYFGTLPGNDTGPGEHVLDHTTRVLPYVIRNPRRVAVLGAATGMDVQHALKRDAREVVAVEPHRDAMRLLVDTHPDWNGALYHNPQVTLERTTIRRFLAGMSRTGDDRFDLIVTPVIGQFGGTAGVNALDEQYHLTREAFWEMYRNLNPGGMIVSTVWLEDPARPSLKLVSTWRDVLESEGIRDVTAHLAAVRSWSSATFIMSNQPLSGVETERIRSNAATLAFDPLILKDLETAERSRFHQLADDRYFQHLDAILTGDTILGDTTGDSPFNLRPARDDRPYFSHFLRLSRIHDLLETFELRELPYLELGYFLALAAAVQAVVVALVLIVVPLAGSGWRGGGRAWTLLYFSGTGAGYMLFEISLIQQLLLYLGQPVFVTAAVLSVLLIASGLGSLVTAGMQSDRRSLQTVAWITALLVVITAIALQPLLHRTIMFGPVIRGGVTILVTGVPGFFMGMLFPLGLRRLQHTREEHIPWACAIDSCLAVSATAPATLIALGSGLTAVSVIAAGAYLVVAIVTPRLGGQATR